MRILIVEDDRPLAETVGDYLTLHEHLVEYAYDGKMALELVRQLEFDVVILDINMPRLDGLDTCRTLRADGNTVPILILTARDTLQDKLAGFQSGGDDYLVKPFAMEELHARVRALHARGGRRDVGRLRIGDLELVIGERRAVRAGKTLALNNIQFRLLYALASVSPAVVSRESLEYQIWGDELPEGDALRTHIYRLRRIVDKPFAEPLIHTVHGQGFRLESEQK